MSYRVVKLVDGQDPEKVLSGPEVLHNCMWDLKSALTHRCKLPAVYAYRENSEHVYTYMCHVHATVCMRSTGVVMTNLATGRVHRWRKKMSGGGYIDLADPM